MPLVRQPAQAAATAPSSTSTPPTAAFAECTRKTFQAGQKDWYQIHAPTHFSNFDICPDCHKTSIAPTQYARFTSLASPKSEEISTRCDFSDLWIRIAYAWLVTQRYPDLTLLGQVAEIQAPEGTCPNLDLECEEVLKGGKKAETRTWYCFTDPKTNTQIEDLTVCSDCVAHIELIFPNLNGILTPACGGQKVLATCDLMSLGDAKQRCLNYLDQLIQVAETTIQKGSRDITPLTDYIKKWAPVPVCRGSENVTGVNCYEMPSVLPDAGWTICEECYQKHAAPLLASNPRPAILSYIQPTKSPLPNGFICDLYSPRMQQYFTSAATTNDLSDFKRKIEARSQKYTEMQMQLQRLRMQHAQQKTQADAYMQMGRMAQQTAMTASMARTIAGGWGLPNFDASQAQMQNAMQMAMQADSTAANIKQVEKEWADFWE